MHPSSLLAARLVPLLRDLLPVEVFACGSGASRGAARGAHPARGTGARWGLRTHRRGGGGAAAPPGASPSSGGQGSGGDRAAPASRPLSSPFPRSRLLCAEPGRQRAPAAAELTGARGYRPRQRRCGAGGSRGRSRHQGAAWHRNTDRDGLTDARSAERRGLGGRLCSSSPPCTMLRSRQRPPAAP